MCLSHSLNVPQIRPLLHSLQLVLCDSSFPLLIFTSVVTGGERGGMGFTADSSSLCCPLPGQTGFVGTHDLGQPFHPRERSVPLSSLWNLNDPRGWGRGRTSIILRPFSIHSYPIWCSLLFQLSQKACFNLLDTELLTISWLCEAF